MPATLIHDSVSERYRVASFLKGWEVAPAGHSGRSCPHCKTYFTDASILEMCIIQGSNTGTLTCFNCGTISTPKSSNIGIRKDDVHLIDDENVFEKIWYHATLIDGWYGKMISKPVIPLVHLGTKDAAMARARDISLYIDSSSWNIYGVKLSSDAKLSKIIMDDEDEMAPSSEHKNKKFILQGYQLNGVTRYVNRFECEGSISLIANPRIFSVVSHQVLN